MVIGRRWYVKKERSLECGSKERSLIRKQGTTFDGWGCNQCGWKYSDNLERYKLDLTLIKASFDKHDCQNYPILLANLYAHRT